MKKILLSLLTLVAFNMLQAQGTHEKGQLNIYADLAFANTAGGSLYAGHSTKIKVGPAVSIVYGIHEDISLGGMIMTTFGSSKSTQFHKDHYHEYKRSGFNMHFGPRASYHFGRLLNMPANLDWYAGLSIGTVIYNSRFKETTNHGTEIDYVESQYSGTGASFYAGPLTGFKWNFANSMGLHAELGGGINIFYAQLGIAFQL